MNVRCNLIFCGKTICCMFCDEQNCDIRCEVPDYKVCNYIDRDLIPYYLELEGETI